MLPEKLKNRLCIVCGHYGAGKTNVAVNLAKAFAGTLAGTFAGTLAGTLAETFAGTLAGTFAETLAGAVAKTEKRVCIADIDTVNPYFRAADNAAELEALGVRCIIPRYANTNVDIPCLPAEFQSVFHSDERCVIDVGGDDGAAAISVYRDDFTACGFDMLYVYNAFRPLTCDVESALDSLRYIEERAGLKATGIVNNSNLGAETTASDVIEGEKKCRAFSEAAGVPFLGSCAFRSVAGLEGREDLFLMENATKRLF